MAAPALFAGLVDDAALFPPGNAPMDRALAEHAIHRRAPYADVIGPFVCPASRVAELREALPPEQRLSVAVVVDVGGDDAHSALRAVGADDRLTLAAVEAALTSLGDAAEVVGANVSRLPGTTGFLEVARDGTSAGLDLVGRSGWAAAKYRTGGTTAAAFPSEAELAAFLVEATGRDIPFKLTAGLHHAVRHTGADTGFEHHGVLNVLVATRAAQSGRGPDEVAAILAERDAGRLTAVVGAWAEDDAARVRRAFRSFGCCGVTDPVDDLVELGLLQVRTSA